MMQTQQTDARTARVEPTLVQDALAERLDQTVSNPRRVGPVQRTALLDTRKEKAFDSLVRLAANLINTPARFLSIVDDKRDFYKSQCGFPESVAIARQVSGRTFCHYVVAGSAPLVIDDTHAHPAWREVAMVENLVVRAYLGVPVVIDGQLIGSFSAIDTSPRKWKASEIETLVQLSLATTREMELRGALGVAEAETVRANELAKANEGLLAVVAHDLRTPLAVMRMCATLLSATDVRATVTAALRQPQEVRTGLGHGNEQCARNRIQRSGRPVACAEIAGTQQQLLAGNGLQRRIRLLRTCRAIHGKEQIRKAGVIRKDELALAASTASKMPVLPMVATARRAPAPAPSVTSVCSKAQS